MDTNRLFTTFGKDGNEILLFMQSVDNYINFINDETVNKDDIQLETLLEYRKTIKTIRFLPSSVAKKLYIMDRDKIVDADNLFIGCKCTIVNYDKEVKWNRCLTYYIEHTWNYTNKEFVIYKYFKSKRYKDINYDILKNVGDQKLYIQDKQDTNIYLLPKFKNGTKIILVDDNYISFADYLKEKYLTKKKVYELANYLKYECSKDYFNEHK